MKKFKGTTKLSLTIRIVVGVYILYTAMSLVKAIPQSVGTEKILFIAFTAFFTVTGVLLVVFAGKALLYRQYDDGSDTEEDSNDNKEDNNGNLDNIELTNEEESLTKTETATDNDDTKNEKTEI